MEVEIRPNITGRILDIGGGGEGIMGRVYGNQVTAIDISQAELDEAPEGFEKILMDAADMSLPEASFDNVTAFYSMMFISKSKHEAVISEATRVLKPGGRLYIWDAAFDEADPYIVHLTIRLPEETIETTYGVFETEAAQSATYLIGLCQQQGLDLLVEQTFGDQFYLCFEKPV
ncbi:MAG TPA: methyltransferase domain-containing protein [Tissierellia bacterium]|nr:methyltransferase domain-containing protein [Tissierellia bacterium]